MIRINEIKMPLGCTEEEVKQATAKALKIKESDIKAFSLARRSIDSRKKDNIILVYSAEIETDLMQMKRLNVNAVRTSHYPNEEVLVAHGLL